MLLFERDEDAIREFGAPGQGPGELLSPDRVGVIGGALYVYQSESQKVTTFDLRTGNLIDSWTPESSVVAVGIGGDRVYGVGGTLGEPLLYDLGTMGQIAGSWPLDFDCAEETGINRIPGYRIAVAATGAVTVVNKFSCGHNYVLNWFDGESGAVMREDVPIGRDVPEPSRPGSVVSILDDVATDGRRFFVLLGLHGRLEEGVYALDVDVFDVDRARARIGLAGGIPSAFGADRTGSLLLYFPESGQIGVYAAAEHSPRLEPSGSVLESGR